MSRLPRPSKTKTYNSNPATINLNPSSLLVVFAGTLIGVVFGVLLSVGFMKPMLKSAVASATKGLHGQVLAMAPAANLTSCATTTGASGGQVLGASTSLAPSNTEQGGSGSGGSGGSKTIYIHKLVSGIFATTTASNSNTGPDSSNSIVTRNTNTTTVTNNNDISGSNANSQSASSGNASSEQNTTAGNTASGAASNTNKSDLSFNISN